MHPPRIIHEDHYVSPGWRAARPGPWPPGATLLRTARFSPCLHADAPRRYFHPMHLSHTDSYAVLVRPPDQPTPQLAGFLTWYPADPQDTRWPHDVTGASGRIAWRLAYGFVAAPGASTDASLQTVLKPIADPVWQRVRPDLYALLTTQLMRRLEGARRFFRGNLGHLLADRYAHHLQARLHAAAGA